jgi:hypothetical protein
MEDNVQFINFYLSICENIKWIISKNIKWIISNNQLQINTSMTTKAFDLYAPTLL